MVGNAVLIDGEAEGTLAVGSERSSAWKDEGFTVLATLGPDSGVYGVACGKSSGSDELYIPPSIEHNPGALHAL
jgi:hypothetical protein